MKIAMIGHKRIPSREGGIEIVVDQLSTRLVKKGNQVTAYNRKSKHISGNENSATDNKLTSYNGVKLKWIPTPNSSKLNAIVYSALATANCIFKNYDIIHFHAEGPSAMVLLAKMFGKKTVVTIHGLDWQRAKWGGFATKFLKYGERCAAKYADEVIVLSKNMQQYFATTYLRQTNLIPNGITTPTIKDNHLIKSTFDLDKDKYILFLGRIVPEKGIHYLIDAYKQLNTNKKLVIAGSASHTSEYVAQVKDQSKGNDNIIFTGFVDGEILEELYSNAYIYCLPTDLEGMPISLLEAMSYGNCCITSDIDECVQVGNENAVYFEKSNTNDLKEKLQYLIDNKDVVEKYKSVASKYVIEKYNWDDITNQTLNLYKRVAKI